MASRRAAGAERALLVAQRLQKAEGASVTDILGRDGDPATGEGWRQTGRMAGSTSDDQLLEVRMIEAPARTALLTEALVEFIPA